MASRWVRWLCISLLALVLAPALLGQSKEAEWWKHADAAYPPFVEYRAGTDRDIPLFVLEPVTDAH